MLNTDYIKEALRKTGYNVSRTANELDVPYSAVKALAEDNFGSVRQPGTVPENLRGLAKPTLQAFAVAAKAVSEEWPKSSDENIRLARRRYNAGTHEMCQETRPDGFTVLYSIPRKRPVAPRDYFEPEML